MRKVERLTYFEFHPADYLLDTGELDLQQHGAYTVLMFRYYWDGELLKSHVYRDCRIDSDRKAVDFVLSRFFHADGERYIHNRIERELESIKGFIEHQSRAGKASGEARREKKLAAANRRQTPRPNTLEWFGEFWAAYPRKIGKGAAEKAWRKIAPDEALSIGIVKAVNEQRACEQWQREGGKYIPHAATWLNGKRWEDEVKPAAAINTVPSQFR